ncbi:MAG: hypothetical protein IPJ01_11530 [Micavibrio sp.]|nr:hypothetical protein [Micavibrio sp.]
MAKTTDNKKKDSEKKKKSDDKLKKESTVDESKKPLKEEKKSVEVEAPKLNETDLLIKEIYGDEPIKDAIPFPKSEQKTQSGGVIDEYNIDVQRLPQDILNLVNDFVSDFTTLTQNPMMVQLVASIIEKDTKSVNALRDWVEPKKDKLIALKIKVKGGVSVVQSEGSTKTVVDANNINNVVNSMPNNTNNQTNVNQPQQVVHGDNPLIPRQPTGSYEHKIHSNPVIPNNNPTAGIENKQIHYDMLNKSNHFADVHKQQNLQYQPEQIVPVTSERYIQDYMKSIMETINNTFQMLHWQYIPLDVLKGILATADTSFGYEIVQGDEGSYINISKGNDKVTTPRFQMK